MFNVIVSSVYTSVLFAFRLVNTTSGSFSSVEQETRNIVAIVSSKIEFVILIMNDFFHKIMFLYLKIYVKIILFFNKLILLLKNILVLYYLHLILIIIVFYLK